MAKKRGSGEGSIFQEAPDKWVASITVGYEFKDGKRRRIRKKFSAPTRKAVSSKLKTALEDQQNHGNIAPNVRTVGWFLNYWIDQVIATDDSLKPKTVEFYRYIVAFHLLPAFGGIRLEALTPSHVQALLNDKRKSLSERTGKPLSARTVAGIKRTLQTALEKALEDDLIKKNVAATRNRKQGKNSATSAAQFLQVKDALALLASAAEEPLYYALFATILSLGLRLGEALGLTWESVDLAERRLHVRATLQKVDGEFAMLEPKSLRSRRSIDLPAVTVSALAQHVEKQRSAREWAGTGWKGSPWNLVFTTTVGTPLDERNVLRILQDKILTRAGLPKMRIHDLRHSAVAILIAQKVSARAISEILGHSSVAFTLQVYGHLLDEVKRDAADKMDSVLSPQPLVAPSVAPLTGSQKVN